MNQLLMPLRRYSDFSGRSRRREFWTWTLAVAIVELILFGWIAWASSGSGGRMTSAVAIPFVIVLLFGLFVLTPSLAVAVRRLHDQERTGTWVLLAIVPILGALILLVLMAQAGTPGPNRYGADPKSGEANGKQKGAVLATRQG